MAEDIDQLLDGLRAGPADAAGLDGLEGARLLKNRRASPRGRQRPRQLRSAPPWRPWVIGIVVGEARTQQHQPIGLAPAKRRCCPRTASSRLR